MNQAEDAAEAGPLTAGIALASIDPTCDDLSVEGEDVYDFNVRSGHKTLRANAALGTTSRAARRSSIRITCGDDDLPPRAVGTPASFNLAVMALRLVFRAARSSLMIGAKSRPMHAPSFAA